MKDKTVQPEVKKDYSVLFADIKGFSSLNAFQHKLYLREVLPRIYEALSKDDHRPEQANTWGDGVVGFYAAHSSAVRSALALRDTFRNTAWEDKGLPPLQIRVSLNAGEVFVGHNPIRNCDELIGTEVNRAARLEPVVAPNHVYATADFFRRCKCDNVKFESVGVIDLPKGWGSEEIYVVGWKHETLDIETIKANPISAGLDGQHGILFYPPSSKFGHRLLVSRPAKEAIAEYCARSGFWRAEDTVFVESGTLPVFMVFAMYRRCDPISRPKLVVTNNIACALVAMMVEQSAGESFATFPDDEPTNSVLMGGRILNDYTATIPEDLMPPNDDENLVAPNDDFWKSGKIAEYFDRKSVNHVIMMVSKLTRKDGPCAVSPPMRRFKKLLLKYVAEHPGVRLSILGEAEKLTERRGWDADGVDFPMLDSERYWEKVLSSGRTTIIAALSPDMGTAQVGLAKREMRALSEAGGTCILLSASGEQLNLETAAGL